MTCRSVLLCALLAACDTSSRTPSETSGDTGTVETGELDAFLRGLPAWVEYSPPVAERNSPSGAEPVSYDADGPSGEALRCTSAAYDLSTNPGEIAMKSPDAGILWPGALLHGDAHVSAGALRLLAVNQENRAPLSISMQGGGVLGVPAGVSTTIAQPVGSTVREGINQLVVNAIDADIAIGAGTSSFSMIETHSTEQSMLAAGFDARYLGAEVSGDVLENRSAGETVITATFVQRLFTVAVDQPENPSDFFADTVTTEQLQTLGVGADNLPMYIDSVSYGRTLIVTMRSSESAEKLQAALDFSYNSPVGGVSGYSEAELEKTLNSAEFEVFALGGSSTGVDNLITTGSLWEYFESELQINQVEPISFTVRNLGDNYLATVASTTSYDIESCDSIAGGLPQPAHWWPMDGSLDDVRGEHHLADSGSDFGAGVEGQAMSLDGGGDYALIYKQDSPVPTESAYTLSAWISVRSDEGWHAIASMMGAQEKTGDFVIWAHGPTGSVLFERRPDASSTRTEGVTTAHNTLGINEWVHLVAVYGVGPDGEAGMRLYLDGVLQSNGIYTSAYDGANGETYFRVGAGEYDADFSAMLWPMAGGIDELMLFDRALSSDEAALLYALGGEFTY